MVEGYVQEMTGSLYRDSRWNIGDILPAVSRPSTPCEMKVTTIGLYCYLREADSEADLSPGAPREPGQDRWVRISVSQRYGGSTTLRNARKGDL